MTILDDDMSTHMVMCYKLLVSGCSVALKGTIRAPKIGYTNYSEN